jgi:copper(I)-binding protein
MRSIGAVAVLLLAAVSLAAPAARAQSVQVEQPWARATAPHASTAAVYVTITANMADRLIGASTPIATTVQVHDTVMDNGVMRMMPVPGGLQLTTGRKVTLMPGGYHLMLMGVTQQLKPGERFPLTLHFAYEPPLTVTVVVAAAGASAPPFSSMHMP